MLSEKIKKNVTKLLLEIEQKSMDGTEKDVQKAMDNFNYYVENLSGEDREIAYMEGMLEIRKIMNKVDEQKKLMEEMMQDAMRKNKANQGYSKY